jgi:hypothetical protein
MRGLRLNFLLSIVLDMNRMPVVWGRDTFDNKDDLGNVEEFSSPNSSNRQNSNLMSPEQHRELERELNKIGDRFHMKESVSKEEDSENPSRAEELEGQADADLRRTLLSKEESKNDEII